MSQVLVKLVSVMVDEEINCVMLTQIMTDRRLLPVRHTKAALVFEFENNENARAIFPRLKLKFFK
jgi:hypothetical protein